MRSERKTCQRIHFILFLGALLAGFSVSNLVPGMTSITQTLGTIPNKVQLTLSAFLVSFAFAQLFYGTISDYYGRRSAYILGMSIFIIGALICYLSTGMPSFILGRFIQGAGIGCATVLSMAILLDVQKQPSALNFTYLIITFMVGIVAAPIIGVFIAYLWHWHLLYLFTGIFAITILLLAIFSLPETNFYYHGEHTFFLWNYWQLMKDRTFMGNVIIACLIVSMPLVIFSTLPLLLATSNHLSLASFTWLMMLCIGLFMIGCYIGYLLTKHLSINNTITFSILLMLIASASGLLLGTLELIYLDAIYIPTCFLLIGAGIALPGTLSACLEKVNAYPGTAIAMQLFCLGIIASLSNLFTAILDEDSQLPLMGLFLIMATFMLLVFWLVVPKNNTTMANV